MIYRIRDIFISATLLILFLPLMIFIMLILLVSQKRIFFTQLRTGYREKPFRLIKFSCLRDIRPGEDEHKDQLRRLTPAGKYLRKSSLDELPQLWLVLTGKMSLVGPRPLMHEYLDRYAQEDLARFSVRPGITGWAQINGRNSIPFKERFQHDIWYIQNRSFWLDLKIIARTFFGIFSSEGQTSEGYTTSPEFDGTN